MLQAEMAELNTVVFVGFNGARHGQTPVTEFLAKVCRTSQRPALISGPAESR
jgi:hypothetical protein